MEKDFSPLNDVTLRQRVYSRLRQAIMSGAFAPGELIVVKRLAESFGTSQMPVRDAVNNLVAEGALKAAANRSVRVPQLSNEHFDQILEARILLEGYAAQQAAKMKSKDDIDALKAANKAMKEAAKQGNVEKVLDENRNFHFALYRASKNEEIYRIIQKLWLRIGPYTFQMIRRLSEIDAEFLPNSLSEALKLHNEIIKAVKAGKSGTVKRLLVQDLDSSKGMPDLVKGSVRADDAA